jgi:hypothetical protein
MEKDGAIPETNEVEYLTRFYKSKTYGIAVGCGRIFICLDYNSDGSFHKIRIPRNTKFNCSLIVRDSLAKQATYQARRDPKQLVKDLKGTKAHACKNYNINCQAFSCSDAVANVIRREFLEVPAKIV